MATSANKGSKPKGVKGAAATKSTKSVKGTASKAKTSKAAVSAVGSMKFSGKTYTKTSCHTTKAIAQKTAKEIRSSGKLARVVGRCVFTRSK